MLYLNVDSSGIRTQDLQHLHASGRHSNQLSYLLRLYNGTYICTCSNYKLLVVALSMHTFNAVKFIGNTELAI